MNLGTLYIQTDDPNGRRSYMTRSSFNVDTDSILIYKALEFSDAARRDGRVFLCTLVPKWKGWIITRLLRVKA